MTRNAKTRGAVRPNQLQNRLRIIAGRWRGVPISFPEHSAIRPTPDRVRETIFNWLQPVVLNARCLDLFAGSGALGFEALSRGAAHVVFVDRDREITRHIEQSAAKLRASALTIATADALEFLSGDAQPFDVVFVDPPYAADIVRTVCERLAQGWLAPGAYVYVEASADAGLPKIPSTWSVHRSKRTGQVGYHLLRVS